MAGSLKGTYACMHPACEWGQLICPHLHRPLGDVERHDSEGELLAAAAAQAVQPRRVVRVVVVQEAEMQQTEHAATMCVWLRTEGKGRTDS